MIISEQYGFIFVHIPKTAGMSVRDAFSSYGRPLDYGRERKRSIFRSITRRLPIRENVAYAHFRGHDPVSKVIQKFSRPVFDRFLSFSVVRNPFDHAVSHYEYMKQFRIKDTAEKVGRLSFREYLEYRMKPPFWNDTIFARLPDQTYFLTDTDGKLAVTRLVRFENLAAELEQLAADLKLPEFKLTHVNKTKSKSDKRPFQSYYDETTEDLVRKIYDRDFDLIGFSREMPQ